MDKFTLALTYLALSFAALTLLSDIVTGIVARVASKHGFWFDWDVSQGLEGIIAPVTLPPSSIYEAKCLRLKRSRRQSSPVLISAFNLRRFGRKTPVGLLSVNVLLDAAIAFFILAYAVSGFAGVVGRIPRHCSGYGDYDHCDPYMLPPVITVYLMDCRINRELKDD